MINTILATKKNSTQTFTTQGLRLPVTKVQAGPCVVTQVKTQERDGYSALQLGFLPRKKKSLSKALLGHLKKSQGDQNQYLRYLREVKVDRQLSLKLGDTINLPQILQAGDIVKVTGISKGKGFTGVMKRWGFSGGPKTHGQSDRPRAPGSIGQGTTPGRVHKGKKMPGRSGNSQVTIKNILVLKITNNGELWLQGQVPGSRNGLLIIQKTGTDKKYSGLLDEDKQIADLPQPEIADISDQQYQNKAQNPEKTENQETQSVQTEFKKEESKKSDNPQT